MIATQLELAWAAGFIDGEGYIGIQPKRRINAKGVEFMSTGT